MNEQRGEGEKRRGWRKKMRREKVKINKHTFTCLTKLSMLCDLYLQEKILLYYNSCVDDKLLLILPGANWFSPILGTG